MNKTRGIQHRAQRVVIFGPEGIGKSTLASKFPNPLFIDIEGSTSHLDVVRSDRPLTWAHLKQLVAEFKIDPEGHKTLVIDTIDSSEIKCNADVCAAAGLESIEDFGYGKGFTKAAESYAKFLDSLFELNEMGFHVVLLAHAHLRKFEQPDEMGAYDRWELKLSKKCAPLVKEWADMVLFANYKTFVIETEGKKKAQGGKRVLYTTHHPAWDAKNRHGLPDEIPLEFSAISGAIIDGVVTTPPSITPSANDGHESPLLGQSTVAQENPELGQSTVAQEPAPVPSSEIGDIPADLLQLMATSGVTESEICKAVAQQGIYPESTPISKYDRDFITGRLVANWGAVVGNIKKTRGE